MAEVVITIRGKDAFSPIAKSVADSLMGVKTQAGGAGQSAGQSMGAFSKLGGALAGVATGAASIIAANLFMKMASGIGAFAAEGLRAVGASQQLEVRLNSLFASNLMYEKQVSTTTEAVMMSAEALAREQEQMAANVTKRDLLSARIQEQKERLRQLTDQWGAEGLATKTAQARLADMEGQLGRLDAEIAQGVSGVKEYATVTKTDWITSTMTAAEIQEKAREQTEKLTKGIEEIAKISPFPTEKIKEAGAFAVQMGLDADRAVDLTRAMTNMGAAMALPAEEVVFMTNNLKQMAATGKLTTIDMREMSRRGLDLSKVIGIEMGMSVEEFNAKAEESPEIFDELITAITNFSDNTFGGTVDAMAKTLPGMLGNLEDIVSFAARDFWLPIVDALQPMAQEALGFMDQFLSGNMVQIGQTIATSLGDVMGAFESGGLWGGLAQIGTMIMDAWETVIMPQLQILAESMGTFLTEAWTNTIQPTLQGWADQFFEWAVELYPQIPEILGEVVRTMTSFLSERAPDIMDAVHEWRDAIFSWVSDAISNVGQVLGGLLVAIGAWAMSGEAQTSLNEMGFRLGQLLADGIGYMFEEQDRVVEILTKLTTALAAGIAGLTGLLIVIGGQVVAGLLAGMLEKLGVDLEPALFTELSGILSGIWDNLKTIVTTLGGDIILGISQGILDAIDDLNTTLEQIGFIIMQTFKETLGIASPSAMFAEFGLDIIMGLIQGITEGAGALLETMGGLVGDLLGSFVGGSDGEEGLGIDLSGLLGDLTSAVPDALEGLKTIFTTTMSIMAENLLALITGPLTSLVGIVTSIYTVHLPFLQTVAQSVMSAFAGAIQPVLSNLRIVESIIIGIVDALDDMGSAFKSAMKDAVSSIESAKGKLEDAIGVVEDLAEAFRQMADAANAAALAAQGAGDAALAAGVEPPGGRNPVDVPVQVAGGISIPVRAQAGNAVTPGMMGVGAREVNVYNTFHVTINTSEAPGSVAQSLQTLMGLVSSGA
jgi:hypothetical protein